MIIIAVRISHAKKHGRRAVETHDASQGEQYIENVKEITDEPRKSGHFLLLHARILHAVRWMPGIILERRHLPRAAQNVDCMAAKYMPQMRIAHQTLR